MASFFKKALGVFVEFDDSQNKEETTFSNQIPILTNEVSRNPDNHVEAEKFEKYFDNLFEKANFPGPDYFEFFKTMEMLEKHIPDEKARISATFASLSLQGLTKDALLDTAGKYKSIIEQDHINFEKALNDKLKAEVGQRQQEILDLDKKIKANAELIQKLTKEITEAQVMNGKLKTEVMEQENKLTKNKTGYQVACQAVLNKINKDILEIKSTL